MSEESGYIEGGGILQDLSNLPVVVPKKKPVSRKKVIGWCIAGVLTVVCIIVGILVWMVFQDDHADTKPQEASLAIAGPGVAAAMTGKAQEITIQDVNGFLTWLLENKQPEETPEQVYIEQITLAFRGDGRIEAYVPVRYSGMRIAVFSAVKLWFQEATSEICVRVEEIYLGRLPVKPEWVLKFVEEQFPSGIRRDGDMLYLDAEIFAIPLEDLDSELKLTGLSVGENCMMIRTTGLIDAAGDYLKNKLSSIFGHDLDPYIEDFGESLKEFFSGTWK